MIIEAEMEWHKMKELKFPYIYWKDVVIVLRTIDRVIYVTPWRQDLARFKPPLQAKQFDYYYQIGKPRREDEAKYLECIALELQKKLRPYLANKIECKEEVTIQLQST